MAAPVAEALVRHTFLPPRLPGKSDAGLRGLDEALIECLIRATLTIRDGSDSPFFANYDKLRLVLQTAKKLNANGKLDKDDLLSEFRKLEDTALLILHVKEQNAGLLIRQRHAPANEKILFEAFEASPSSTDVLAARSALVRNFPDAAVAIPSAEFRAPALQNELSLFLEQASTECIQRFAARTAKARSGAYESRDTSNPALIVKLLMTILEALGEHIGFSQFQKRIRDEVIWEAGAENPWRRSASWQVFRVGLMSQLISMYGPELARLHYKFIQCLVLNQIIDETYSMLEPDIVAFQMAKLSRRAAKLQSQRDMASGEVLETYDKLFEICGSLFRKSIGNANRHILREWESCKSRIRRPIGYLPRRADPTSLVLSLPNCRSYIQNALDAHSTWAGRAQSAVEGIENGTDPSKLISGHYSHYVSEHLHRFKIEEIIQEKWCTPTTSLAPPQRCMEIAREITSYVALARNSFSSSPEQNSLVLLTSLKLWVAMDQSAIESFSLLQDYSPPFQPRMLEVLHLTSFDDLCALRSIQSYLLERFQRVKITGQTIFTGPRLGCFAQRFHDLDEEGRYLRDLHEKILQFSDESRNVKVTEWQNLSSEFERLQKMIAESTCIYQTQDYGMVHDPRCKKCYLQQKASRMKIEIHEEFLPFDVVQAKAVVFELSPPDAFVAYRKATWMIISSLSSARRNKQVEITGTLPEYSRLKPFDSAKPDRVVLASTSKSFLSTHYRKVRLPISRERVCLPNGMRFEYYDNETKTRPEDSISHLTFAQYCHCALPANSPLAVLQFSPTFLVDHEGPTSNQVIASQTKAPAGVNPHEFVAFQNLYSGETRRWLQLLLELGANNLNFGTKATCSLVSRIALQVGPAHERDPRGVIHQVFSYPSFCFRLNDQIERRLEVIRYSWRESIHMDSLITLITRILTFSDGTARSRAIVLLDKARSYTFEWATRLQNDIRVATNASDARTASKYAFWAAALCKRTLIVYADPTRECNTHTDIDPVKISGNLSETELQHYIFCSIVLHENLPGEPNQLSSMLKSVLIRDLRTVHQLRCSLRRALELHPRSLFLAVDMFWPRDEAVKRIFSITEISDTYWVQIVVSATSNMRQQIVHYHLLEGYLLIDGKPMGKLPQKYAESAVLKELFGEQNLLTFPSALPGMSYRLAFMKDHHEIHIGWRGDGLVVQAHHRGRLLEMIPREVFGKDPFLDLPAPLIQSCVHWLDLQAGVVEARRQPEIWKSRPGNWIIDFYQRFGKRRDAMLIDPHSRVFERIARIFRFFEYPEQIVVIQPHSNSVRVEIRRLELSFFVNPDNLLQCRELKSVVDPDQDAGTWYGLNSKIVLRDATNERQRSILIPVGPISCRRSERHMAVTLANESVYARFVINTTLGRLECPAEPALMYLKAQCHAYTSFVIPDRLTGRTGTEEALICLASANSYPWSPLNLKPQRILRAIADLTPRRTYYPADLRVTQHIAWNPFLTNICQHESFRSIVDGILRVSQDLETFAACSPSTVSLDPAGDNHLRDRHISRYALYAKSINAFHLSYEGLHQDLTYIPRDLEDAHESRRNVYECTSLLRGYTGWFLTATDLADTLQEWPMIGGFDRHFDKLLLSDRLECDIALEWGALVNICRSSRMEDLHRLIFLFAALAFRSGTNMVVLRTLIAYSCVEELKAIKPPTWSSYTRFRKNQIPTSEHLTQLIDSCRVPYPGDQRQLLGQRIDYSLRKKLEATQADHERQTSADCKTLADHFAAQWPRTEPGLEGLEGPLMLDVLQALSIVGEEWARLLQNFDLSRYLHRIQAILGAHTMNVATLRPTHQVDPARVFPVNTSQRALPPSCNDILRRKDRFADHQPVTVVEIPRRSLPVDSTKGSTLSSIMNEGIPLTKECANVSVKSTNPALQELGIILRSLITSSSNERQRYGQDLMRSLEALTAHLQEKVAEPSTFIPLPTLAKEVELTQQQVQNYYVDLNTLLKGADTREPWLIEGGLWPAITPIVLLENLRSNIFVQLGSKIKELLIKYAVCLTLLQQLLRLEDASKRGNRQAVQEELNNPGHQNWRPEMYPDWLLLEIESNMLIRPDQIDVALATISPRSRSNSVLQMNMGQGKTSCVIPMVAAALTDTVNLTRIIVPKALLLQTAQLMQARLGGLLARRVVHVPFSRKTPTTAETTAAFRKLHESIIQDSGVMLTLPEHLLSFKLSGLQRLSEKRSAEAKPMISTQAWLQKVSRDVLDESDFTLAVRTQLIYPSGEQVAVDGHPQRWEVAEALLQLVQGHLWDLQRLFPRSIEIVNRLSGGYPVIFLLRKDVEDALLSRLVDDVCLGRLRLLPINKCHRSERTAIKAFLSSATIRSSVYERIRQNLADQPTIQKVVYLLRGFLVHRILLLTLKKRWNVQYGLHPARDPIAVPYLAKGVPSDQSEFGHPDVAICFTCLAFYFSGLSISQLRESLENILRSDDPATHYERWIFGINGFPDVLKDWSVINVGDATQLEEVWQYVRFQVSIINYYMNHFVFPRHAKQFQTKLQTSGWDIPLSMLGVDGSSADPDPTGAPSQHLTTGFSGTNDNKAMLPLTIKQRDLPGLSHTNAEVLTYLLQPRNRFCFVSVDQFGHNEIDLLDRLKRMKIRMLIDAGAQILEMDNLALVKEWLKIDHEAPGAIFFDKANKPTVLYRNGQQIPLLASPFADNIQDCLVYLDEAHTRGTDLKMLPNAQGALTLGLGQTKDHTVQAAMRLRKLGTTQSLVFVIPPEVHQSILDLVGKSMGDHFDSGDVVRWLLEQTCVGIEQLQPLYFSQGVDFCRRTQAAISNREFLVSEEHRQKYVSMIRQPEKQTLERLYQPVAKQRAKVSTTELFPEISLFMKELQKNRKAFQDIGNAVQASALQEVEQEREVAYEVQSVRESQKPVHYSPFLFLGLDCDIAKFVETGRLPAPRRCCQHFFAFLRRTTIGSKHEIDCKAMDSRLYLSNEFCRTVDTASFQPNTDFVREVTWILWSPAPETALIVSPEEAELILPRLFGMKNPQIHLLIYAAPITRSMTIFNHVNFYAVPSMSATWIAPSWLAIELLIFAGGLYFDFDLYSPLRKYLGLPSDETDIEDQPNDEAENGEEAGSIAPPVENQNRNSASFTAKPLSFLHDWLATRRKGQDFMHTPMGHVCQGKRLHPDHPFFAEPGHATKAKASTNDRSGLVSEKASTDRDFEDVGSDGDDEGGDPAYGEEELKNDTLDDQEVEWEDGETFDFDAGVPGESN